MSTVARKAEVTTENAVVASATNIKPAKEKNAIKICKVLWHNPNSLNFAFEYDKKPVQITLRKPMKYCSATVKVEFKNGQYKIIN